MDNKWMGLVEMVLVLGGTIAFGIWQLRSVRRDQRRREESERAAGAKEPPPRA